MIRSEHVGSKTKINDVSDTAFWVASYREQETLRADALFKDPLASVLAAEKGRNIGNTISAAKYAAWTVIIRTHVIDQMILSLIDKGTDAILNLGAGLDTRPYRLGLPSQLKWIEVDQPSIIEFKTETLKGYKPNCRLEHVDLDLSDTAKRRTFFDRINVENQNVAVITEGVLPYLDEGQVSGLANDLLKQPHFLYWITEYHSKKMNYYLRKRAKHKEMKNAPFRFFPDDWSNFFHKLGWQEGQTVFMIDEGERIGRPFPIPLIHRVLMPLMGARRREEFHKMMGYSLLIPRR